MKYVILITIMVMGLGRGVEIQWTSGPREYWPFWAPVHQKIVEKGISLLNINELKIYKEKIKEGASCIGEDEGDDRRNNHGYNPRTGKGKLIKDSYGTIYGHYSSALEWGVTLGKSKKLDGSTLKEVINDYDYNDAIAWYKKGHKVNAYKCLGYVVHLLQDVAMPSHCLPPKASDLNNVYADIGLKEEKYEQKYIGDNYQDFLDDATSVIWEGNIEQQFYNLAINAQDKGKRYRKAYYQGTNTIIEEDSLDIYNLDYDDSKSIVYDEEGKKVIKAEDAYYNLLSSLLPLAVSYSAGLFKHFYDTRPTPDPAELDYIDFFSQLLGISKIRENVCYKISLSSNGDAISFPVTFKVDYKTKKGELKNLISETKEVSLETCGGMDIYTPYFVIPQDAIELIFSYTLNYGVKPKGESRDYVWSGYMEILCNPQRLFLNETFQNLIIEVVDDKDNTPIDGVRVDLKGCGIETYGTTNTSGKVSFSINPTYPRNDDLFNYLSISAKTEKYNYNDASTNILCIDRNPPNIINFKIPGTGSNYALITYNTDVPSGGEVECNGMIVKGLQEVKSQELKIKGLSPGINYPFTIKAWTKYSKDYGKFSYKQGNFKTRDYNHPPKIIIYSPSTGTTYKATCTIKFLVEDNDPTNGGTDPMDITILYSMLNEDWKLVTSYTKVYSGTTTYIWNTENVGSGTFNIMIIATDYNDTFSTATSGTFTIISPLTITTNVKGKDGGQKNGWSTQFKTILDDCPRCGKDIAYGVYIV